MLISYQMLHQSPGKQTQRFFASHAQYRMDMLHQLSVLPHPGFLTSIVTMLKRCYVMPPSTIYSEIQAFSDPGQCRACIKAYMQLSIRGNGGQNTLPAHILITNLKIKSIFILHNNKMIFTCNSR